MEMQGGACESFIIAKADFASFVVIVRHADNSVSRVEGFLSDTQARDWISYRIGRRDENANSTQTRLSLSSTLLPDQDAIPISEAPS